MELTQFLHQSFKKTGTLHHAYCIEGDVEASFSGLSSFFSEVLGMEVLGNPDVWHAMFDTFGIDESRELIEWQSRKAVGGGKKIFVVGAQSVTREAQNALLKVFEEPQGDTHFFLCTPSAEMLLPTLRSRMSVIACDLSVQEKPGDSIMVREIRPKAFLAAPLPKRLTMLKHLIDSKNKSEAIAFLNALETSLYNDNTLRKGDAAAAMVFEEIMLCRGYLRDSAPSVKMLLEHLALSVPIAK